MIEHVETNFEGDKNFDSSRVIFRVGDVQVLADGSIKTVPDIFKNNESGVDSDSVEEENYIRENTEGLAEFFEALYPKEKPMNMQDRLLCIFDSFDNIRKLNVLYDDLKILDKKASLSRTKMVEAAVSGKITEFNKSQEGIDHQDVTLQLMEKQEEIDKFLISLGDLRSQKERIQEFSQDLSLKFVNISDEVVKIIEENPEGEILTSKCFADGRSNTVQILLRCGDYILQYIEDCERFGSGSDVTVQALKVEQSRT